MIGGMGKTILILLWRSHNNDQVVHDLIIHVAGAVTDTDETYGAYVAADNNNNTSSNYDFFFLSLPGFSSTRVASQVGLVLARLAGWLALLCDLLGQRPVEDETEAR